MLQVAAALLTLHGRMIESTSRPCLVPHRSTLVQYARYALVIAGSDWVQWWEFVLGDISEDAAWCFRHVYGQLRTSAFISTCTAVQLSLCAGW